MKEKRYRHRTKVLGIPVPGYNHPILPSVEMKKWQFIENLLIASMSGLKSCVFNEGVTTVEKNEDGTYKARLSSSKGGCSISGLAGGRYFESRSVVEWDSLKSGYKYFLYMVTNVKTSEDPRRVRAVASSHKAPPSSVLVAEVSLRDEEPVVNIEPYGKVSRRIMERHVALQENPHGKTLLQEEMAVKRLAITESLEMDEGGPLNVEGLREASSMQWSVSRVDSNGEAGVVISVSGAVRMASVSFEEEPSSGDAVWVGYHGVDEKASKPDEVVIYNRDSGVKLRVAVLCER